MKKILIALPAFNEAEFLGDVIFEIARFVDPGDILVVDDGSTDQTAGIASRHRIRLIQHPKNKGKGAAIKTAVQYARDQGYHWLLTMDADGQHQATDLPAFFTHLDNPNLAMILGNRSFSKSNMPWQRRLSNGIASVIISLCSGSHRFLDSQCGFRAMRVNTFPVRRISENGFHFESESLLRLGRMQQTIVQIDIHTHYGRESSSISAINDTIRFLILVFKSFFW